MSERHAVSIFLLLAACLLVAPLWAILGPSLLQHSMNMASKERRNYTYIGSDFPREWPIPPLVDVLLGMEDTVHYQVETTSDALGQFESILPSGGGLLHLGEHGDLFTISMFHQLRCLGIVGSAIAARTGPIVPSDAHKRERVLENAMPGREDELESELESAMALHCLNYLRLMIMCRVDLHLEPYTKLVPPRNADIHYDYTCKDWNAVYAAAEENYRSWQKL